MILFECWEVENPSPFGRIPARRGRVRVHQLRPAHGQNRYKYINLEISHYLTGWGKLVPKMTRKPQIFGINHSVINYFEITFLLVIFRGLGLRHRRQNHGRPGVGRSPQARQSGKKIFLFLNSLIIILLGNVYFINTFRSIFEKV